MPRMERMSDYVKDYARWFYKHGFRSPKHDFLINMWDFDGLVNLTERESIKWWLKRQAAQDASRCKPKRRS